MKPLASFIAFMPGAQIIMNRLDTGWYLNASDGTLSPVRRAAPGATCF
jgi:hypothetical protein